MTDDVRDRLGSIIFAMPSDATPWEIADAILADPSLVVLPAKVVDDVIAAIVVVLDQSQHVAHRTRLVRTADALIEAVRLAQEEE